MSQNEIDNDEFYCHVRFDEIRKRGSLTKRIAWSKSGVIVHIPINEPDTVGVCFLECGTDLKWGLSAAKTIEQFRTVHDGINLQHLMWSPGGQYLACIDEGSRLSVWEILDGVFLNRLTPVFTFDLDDNDDEIVALHWLSIEKQLLVSNPASKREKGQFAYSFQTTKPVGPYLKGNRNALIALSKSGKINLWYKAGLQFLEISVSLQGHRQGTEKSIIRASFASEVESSLLLATLNSSGQTRIFRISLDFDDTQSNPSLSSSPLFTQELHNPDRAFRHVVHFELVASELYAAGSSLRLLLTFGSTCQETTWIELWAICKEDTSIHWCFKALQSAAQVSGSQVTKIYSLALESQRLVQKRVAGIDLIHSNSMSLLYFIDGSVSVRKLPAFEYVEVNTMPISTIFSAGYGFDGCPSRSRDIAFSPSSTCFVYLRLSGELILEAARNSVLERNESNVMEACAALAQRFSIACFNQYGIEDVVILGLQLRVELRLAFLKESYRAMQVNVDWSKDLPADRLMAHNGIHRGLCLQYLLYRQDFLPGTIALSVLQLRSCGLCINSELKKLKPAAGQEVNFRLIMQSLEGVIRWLFSYSMLLAGTLLIVRQDDKFKDVGTITEDGKIIPDDIHLALILMITSLPRILIRWSLRTLKAFEMHMKKQKTMDSTGGVTFAASLLRSITESLPIQLSSLEKVLEDIDLETKRAFPSAPLRMEAEQSAIMQGRIAKEFTPVIEKAAASFEEHVKPTANLPELYYYDHAWLGLSSEVTDQKEIYDIIHKKLLPNKRGNLRRCIRCRSLSRIDHDKGIFPSIFKHECICGSSWVKE